MSKEKIESKELTSLIMDVRKPTHGYCSDMTAGYEWPNNSISNFHKNMSKKLSTKMKKSSRTYCRKECN